MKPTAPGITSTRGVALVEVFRASLASLDSLAPAEQDAIVGAIVAAGTPRPTRALAGALVRMVERTRGARHRRRNAGS